MEHPTRFELVASPVKRWVRKSANTRTFDAKCRKHAKSDEGIAPCAWVAKTQEPGRKSLDRRTATSYARHASCDGNQARLPALNTQTVIGSCTPAFPRKILGAGPNGCSELDWGKHDEQRQFTFAR